VKLLLEIGELGADFGHESSDIWISNRNLECIWINYVRENWREDANCRSEVLELQTEKQ
jgi:hypothetical protein